MTDGFEINVEALISSTVLRNEEK